MTLDAFQAALRLEVGREGLHSVAHVAKVTGMSTTRLYQIRSGDDATLLAEFVRLSRVLSPEFIGASLAPAGVTLVSKGEEYNGSMWHVVGDLGEAVRHVSEICADGRIDHRERPEMLKALRCLLTTLQGTVAALENGREKV